MILDVYCNLHCFWSIGAMAAFCLCCFLLFLFDSHITYTIIKTMMSSQRSQSILNSLYTNTMFVTESNPCALCAAAAAVALHWESITSRHGFAFTGYCLMESAAHLNALGGINDDISSVCPGQSIKRGPLKVKWTGCPPVHPPIHPSIRPSTHPAHTGHSKGEGISRVMWVKMQIKSQLSH